MMPYAIDSDLFAGMAIAGVIGLIVGVIWLVRTLRDPDDEAPWRYRDRD